LGLTVFASREPGLIFRWEVNLRIFAINQLPYLTGQQPESARHEFYYFLL
jgi:hypothetical protein